MIHSSPTRRLVARRSSEAKTAPGLDEVVRSGVQVLAFRSGSDGLTVSLQPGGARLAPVVLRAAEAAMDAHLALAVDDPKDRLSTARDAAVRARDALERQLDDVRSKIVRSPKVALRQAYLDALADYVTARLRQDGGTSLEE